MSLTRVHVAACLIIIKDRSEELRLTILANMKDILRNIGSPSSVYGRSYSLLSILKIPNGKDGIIALIGNSPGPDSSSGSCHSVDLQNLKSEGIIARQKIIMQVNVN